MTTSRKALGDRFVDSAARELGVGGAVGALAGFLATDLGLPALVSYWRDWTTVVVACTLLGTILWRTRLWPLVGVTTGGLGIIWVIVVLTPLCRWMAADLVRRDPIEPADAIFVLSSRIQNDGELSETAMSRLFHGLELLGEKKAPLLILSELRAPSRSYAAVARTMMEHLGIRADLLVVGPVTNTHEEAKALGALFRRHRWNRVLVVTSPAHSRRAAAALEHEGVAVVSSPSMETHYPIATLDRPGDRRNAFGSLIHEWVGLWIYQRRGWLPANNSR